MISFFFFKKIFPDVTYKTEHLPGDIWLYLQWTLFCLRNNALNK